MKKFLCVLLAAVLFVTLCGCSFLKDVGDLAANDVAQDKTFEFDDLSIELTTDFLRMEFLEDEEWDFVVGSEKITVMGLKEDVEEDLAQEITVTDYANAFRSILEVDSTEIIEKEGIPMMQYTADGDNGKNTINVAFYKGTNCFWTVCFGTKAGDFDENYDEICKYAKTVKCK